MTYRRIGLLVVTALFAGHALAQDDPPAPDIDTLAAKAIATDLQLDAIRDEREAAIGETRTQRLLLERQARGWADEPVDEAAVAKLNDEIANTKAYIETLKQRIVELEELRDTAEVTDPEARAAKAAALKEQADALRAKERELAAPFQDRRRAIREAVADDAAAFSQAMKRYFKDAEGGLELAVRPSLMSAFTSATWDEPAAEEGERGQRVAWAHVLLHPEQLADHQGNLFEDTYPILSRQSNGLWVRAGHAEVRFIVEKDEWRDPAQVAAKLKELIDLEALAKIKPRDPSP